MTKVIKELAVAVSTYEDHSTGKQKNRYKNVGVLMETEGRDGQKNRFLLLDRSFNPAGVPAKPGSDKIIVSMFSPQEERSHDAGSRAPIESHEPGASRQLDDEIPF